MALCERFPRAGRPPGRPAYNRCCGGLVGYGLVPNSVLTVTPLPPRIEDSVPLAVLSSPPLTEDELPLAVPLNPPLTAEFEPLAVLLAPPLTEEVTPPAVLPAPNTSAYGPDTMLPSPAISPP